MRVVVELNDMSYGNQYEILVDRMRNSFMDATRSRKPQLLKSKEQPKGKSSSSSSSRSKANNRPVKAHASPLLAAATATTTTHRTNHRRDMMAPSPCALRAATSVTSPRDDDDNNDKNNSGSGRNKRWFGRKFLSSSSPTANIDVPQRLSPRTGSSNANGSVNEGISERRGRHINAGGIAAGAVVAGSAGRRAGVSRRFRSRMHWSLSSGFASGAVVPNNLPETLLCQAFYNPAIIKIVEALLDPTGHGTRHSNSCHLTDVEHPIDNAGGMGGVDITHGGNHSASEGEAGGGGGGPSFLAQIAPPKSFFMQAMHTGNRPDFQVSSLLPFELLMEG